MSLTGLLVLSNVSYIKKTFNSIQNYIKSLYIHLNVGQLESTVPPNFSRVISRIYCESLASHPNIDIRIIVENLKNHQKPLCKKVLKQKIDMVFVDGRQIDNINFIQDKYQIPNQTTYLSDNEVFDIETNMDKVNVYNTVVVGGTFDRIHLGHKILLTEAVLRATKKVIVGVTDENMTVSKKLPELILPIEQRIKDVEEFLVDIDSSLQYQVVSIQDPFGPTKSDPEIDMIIVSDETLRGGEKVNELRTKNGLNKLDIVCINLINADNVFGPMETKISSSNTRINLLGTRIKSLDFSSCKKQLPYIIGLTGGIASGKSTLANKFELLGGHVMDCDKIAHEIYEPGQNCYDKIIMHFGKEILDEKTNKIDRKKLGAIVFDDSKELDVLNQIVWPELIKEVKRRINEVYRRTGQKIFIIEAAILLKAGWETECNEIWSMIIPPEEAIKRMVSRDSLSEVDAKKRLSMQLDNKTIVEKSHVVFSSQWDKEFTQAQAEKAWNMIASEIYS